MIKLMSHLIHLRTFLEVYRSKSFSKAAESLAITQPAASLHIQSLESFIGNKLFIRQSRGCLLYTSPSPRDGLLSRMPSSA